MRRGLFVLLLAAATAAATAAAADFPAPTEAERQAAFPDLGGMSMQEHMGSPPAGKFLLERLEWQDAAADTPLRWDARAWWGGSRDRAAFSSEGVNCLQGPHQGAQKSTRTG